MVFHKEHSEAETLGTEMKHRTSDTKRKEEES
jgi:hypothetical protein